MNQNNQNPPRQLPYASRFITLAGTGRAPGAWAYMDHATARTLEVHRAEVKSTGPHYSLARALDNAALGLIRIDRDLLPGAVALGDVLLVAEIEFRSQGLRAGTAWVAPSAPPILRPFVKVLAPPRPQPRPQPRRGLTGTIVNVANLGTYGFISIDGTSQNLFVHSTSMDGRLTVGTRVQFQLGANAHGPVAVAVRPA